MRAKAPGQGPRGKALVPYDRTDAYVCVWVLHKAQAQGFNTGCLNKLTKGKGKEMQPPFCLHTLFTASRFRLTQSMKSAQTSPQHSSWGRRWRQSWFLSALNKKILTKGFIQHIFRSFPEYAFRQRKFSSPSPFINYLQILQVSQDQNKC